MATDRDPITPPLLSEEIVAAIPNSRLVIIPECDHSLTLEQPEAVNRTLVTCRQRSPAASCASSTCRIEVIFELNPALMPCARGSSDRAA
nr:alpha/beta hydrolase [Agrobacterium vitis]